MELWTFTSHYIKIISSKWIKDLLNVGDKTIKLLERRIGINLMAWDQAVVP